MRKVYSIVLLVCTVLANAQNADYNVALIAPELKENANAVVRQSDMRVEILSQRDMRIITQSVITVLNEEGLRYALPYEQYSKTYKIVSVGAIIYDASGRELKSFRRKDFRDQSMGDGYSVFLDDRIIYLPYTPVAYPFTIAYECEIRSSNTAFIPKWSPYEGYLISTEAASFSIASEQELGLQHKEVNYDPRYNIVKKEIANGISYSASALKAIRNEDASPEFIAVAPMLYSRVRKFNLEGVDGEADNWQDFGKFVYNNLVAGSDVLSEETTAKMKQWGAEEKDRIALARKIYNYVQNRTRYVNISIGIGGFKPIAAKDVDRLGYGDCKALSNYTRSLLKAAGVESYYTIVHAETDFRKGLMPDFASVQGNHIILALPVENDILWMECTSQSIPFGFQGSATDGRDVLLIKPDGGELVKTHFYNEKDNAQLTKGEYAIDGGGHLNGKLSVISSGIQYGALYPLMTRSEQEKEKYYKERFGNLNGVKLLKPELINDVEKVTFTENVSLSAQNYATMSGAKLIFPVNAFNPSETMLHRYRNRTMPFQVNRGYFDEDEVMITLPEGYDVEALPETSHLSGKFGEYHAEITQSGSNTLRYKRSFLLKDGYYPASEYESYRLFREQVARLDNAKVILNKKT